MPVPSEKFWFPFFTQYSKVRIKTSGGRNEVQNEPNKDSVFTVYSPIQETE